MIPPAIKWSGSKRSMAPGLAKLLPRFESYIEPFLGSAALLPYTGGTPGWGGDIVSELIGLWKAIRDDPDPLIEEYRKHWMALQEQGHTYYYEVRSDFNLTRDPAGLLFLSRTCVNGLIRFNSKGDFNNSLHHTRPGIHPRRLAQVIKKWSHYMQPIRLSQGDYRETLEAADASTFVFLDPPYAGTKGRYHPQSFDYARFIDCLEWLNQRGAQWMLTLDGSAGGRTYETLLPIIPARHTLKVESGHSPFTRLLKTSLDNVSESVFLNYDPPIEALSEPSDRQSRLF